MITLEFGEGPRAHAEWMKARLGKITGSRVKNLGKLSKGKNVGEWKEDNWQCVAERLYDPSYQDDTITMSDRDRGNYLEPFACEEYAKKTGRNVMRTKVIWVREDDPSIAISPDAHGLEKNGQVRPIECKALGSGKHLKAIVTNKVPDEHEEQLLHYFIVNDSFSEMDFILYDPRMLPHLKLHVITVKRVDILEKIDEQRERIYSVNEEMDEMTNKLVRQDGIN